MARDLLAFGVIPSDRRYRLQRAKFPVMADAIAELAGALERPPRVLDAGLGQCKLQLVYRHHHGERAVEWHGVDLLGSRLRLRLDVEGIQRAQAALEALPYAEGSFDAVVCSWVFQHLADPALALAELVRVLRPGGLLLLAVPCAPQPLKLLRELVHPLWVRRQQRRGRRYAYNPQIQFYNLPRVRRLARDAGLEVARWQGLGYVTGGPLRSLENQRWYYRFNLWLGRLVPRLAQTLVLQARKPSTGASASFANHIAPR